MEIEQDRLNAFQIRMNSWVAGQGLFFQLRYAAAVQGAKSSIAAALLRLVLRLLILILIVLAGFWYFLVKRVDYGWFRKDIGERVSLSLGADSAVVGAVKRERGQVNIRKLSIVGGKESFFYTAEIESLRTRMGIFDGVLVPWNGEMLSMKTLEIEIKSGADSDEAAAESYLSLFKRLGEFQFENIEVEDATVNWGYSESHRGSIQGARLRVAPLAGGGWRAVFEGGLFTQNWIRRFEIERIVVTLTPEDLVFDEIRLKKEGGVLEMSGKLTRGGGSPEFGGQGRMAAIPIYSLIASEFRDYVDGTISGALQFGGSTNSQLGFYCEANVQLAEGDGLILRDRFALFRAISAVDRFRSYKKVRFGSGSFRMKTGGEHLELADIALTAPDQMRMEGAFLVRPPTPEEVEEWMKTDAREDKSPTLDEPEEGEGKKEDEISLEAAALVGKKDEERRAQTLKSLIIGSQTGSEEVRGLEESAWDRVSESRFIEGRIRLGIPEDAFKRSPGLDEAYPFDKEAGLRWLQVPLAGRIYSLGADLAEDIYLKSRGSR